jgi:hypothetical protein
MDSAIQTETVSPSLRLVFPDSNSLLRDPQYATTNCHHASMLSHFETFMAIPQLITTLLHLTIHNSTLSPFNNTWLRQTYTFMHMLSENDEININNHQSLCNLQTLIDDIETRCYEYIQESHSFALMAHSASIYMHQYPRIRFAIPYATTADRYQTLTCPMDHLATFIAIQYFIAEQTPRTAILTRPKTSLLSDLLLDFLSSLNPTSSFTLPRNQTTCKFMSESLRLSFNHNSDDLHLHLTIQRYFARCAHLLLPNWIKLISSLRSNPGHLFQFLDSYIVKLNGSYSTSQIMTGIFHIDIMPTQSFFATKHLLTPQKEPILSPFLESIRTFLLTAPLEIYMFILSHTLDTTSTNFCQCTDAHPSDATRDRTYIYCNPLTLSSPYSKDIYHRSFSILIDLASLFGSTFYTNQPIRTNLQQINQPMIFNPHHVPTCLLTPSNLGITAPHPHSRARRTPSQEENYTERHYDFLVPTKAKPLTCTQTYPFAYPDVKHDRSSFKTYLPGRQRTNTQ